MRNKTITVPIIFFIGITALPIIAGLSYAFLNSFGLSGILANGFTLQYWKQLFTSNEFLESLLYSFLIMFIVIILAIVLSLFLHSYLKNSILSGATSYIFYIPIAIPFIVAAFISFQLLSASGFFARIAFALNLISDQNQFPSLVNDASGFGVVITHMIIAATFFTILFASIFRNENIEALINAGETLGADEKQIRRKIIFPILLTKAMPTILLYAIVIFGSYEIPLLLGRQNPQMISVTIARKFTRYNLQDIPIAYAMSVTYTFLIIIILIILYKRKKLIHEIN